MAWPSGQSGTVVDSMFVGSSDESVARPVRCVDGAGEFVEVCFPGAATSSPDVDVRVLLRDLARSTTEVSGVARFQMAQCAQCDLVHHRYVGP